MLLGRLEECTADLVPSVEQVQAGAHAAIVNLWLALQQRVEQRLRLVEAPLHGDKAGDKEVGCERHRAAVLCDHGAELARERLAFHRASAAIEESHRIRKAADQGDARRRSTAAQAFDSTRIKTDRLGVLTKAGQR